MGTEFVKVGDVMHTPLLMVSGLETVQGAIDRMREHSVSSLIIERRDRDDEYGMVTVQDIAAKVIARSRSAARTSVYEIMTKPVLTIDRDMNVKYAIRLLVRLDFTRTLVVGDEGLLGLVTLRDLVLGYRDDGVAVPD